MGTCITESNCDPQRRLSVPCMNECTERRSESKRNAGVERVARVKGRNSSICNTVDNLERVRSNDQCETHAHTSPRGTAHSIVSRDSYQIARRSRSGIADNGDRELVLMVVL